MKFYKQIKEDIYEYDDICQIQLKITKLVTSKQAYNNCVYVNEATMAVLNPFLDEMYIKINNVMSLVKICDNINGGCISMNRIFRITHNLTVNDNIIVREYNKFEYIAYIIKIRINVVVLSGISDLVSIDNYNIIKEISSKLKHMIHSKGSQYFIRNEQNVCFLLGIVNINDNLHNYGIFTKNTQIYLDYIKKVIT